jgi:8-oxo-dGTP pyrophosphatase MutT (NUDIX family)
MPDATDRAAAGEEVRAAGAVLWRMGSGGVHEIALIHRERYDDWSFPKGKLEPGEHVLAAAVREVREETGVAPALGRPLGITRYDHDSWPKRVDYWVARSVDGAEQAFRPNREVDQLEWLPLPAARDRLSHAHDSAVLDAFAAAPVQTVPLMLVRHASAGTKAGWPGTDLDRPLDARGAADARALAPLLACYGPARVISSGAERCVATVRPYAFLTGMPVEIEPAFTVDDAEPAGSGGAGERGRPAGQAGGAPPIAPPPGTVAGAAQSWPGPDSGGIALAGSGPIAAVQAILTAERPAVVCAHRENLPDLLGAACDYLGAVPPEGPRLAKGSFWVLHAAGRRLVAAEQHTPTGGW